VNIISFLGDLLTSCGRLVVGVIIRVGEGFGIGALLLILPIALWLISWLMGALTGKGSSDKKGKGDD
jgi:hypothetical protein